MSNQGTQNIEKFGKGRTKMSRIVDIEDYNRKRRAKKVVRATQKRNFDFNL